jgi:hypothetical protein
MFSTFDATRPRWLSAESLRDRFATEWLPKVSARRFRLTNISNTKLWRGAVPPGPWGLARDFDIIANVVP